MANVRTNTLYNYAGRGIQIALPFIAIPFYINLLHPEGFAVLMLTASIQAAISIFDLGLGGTLTREFAKIDKKEGEALEKGVIAFRIIERLYFSVYIVILVLSYPMAQIIATHWLNMEFLNKSDATAALMLAIVSSCSIWIASLYSCGLVGLQKMIEINIISIAINILKFFGGVLLLYAIDVGIQGLLGWYLLCHTVQAVLLRKALIRALFSLGKISFKRASLNSVRELFPYSASLSLSTILSVTISQMDKLILSGTLSLKHFGYYSLAATVAQSLYAIASPIGDAVYPRLMQLKSKKMNLAYDELYRNGLISSAFIVTLTASLISANSYELLLIWSRNTEASSYSYSILTILAFGVTINIVISTLDVVQMTYGCLRPMITARVFLLAVACPLIWISAKSYGAYGAAITWMCAYLFLLIFIPVMVIKNMTRGNLPRWYLGWIPLVVIIFITVNSTAMLLASINGNLNLFVRMSIEALVTLGVTITLFTDFRNILLKMMRS